MSWISIAAAAAAGAIGGVLGGLLALPLKTQKSRRVVAAVGSVVGLSLGRHTLVPMAEAWHLRSALRDDAPASLGETNRDVYVSEMQTLFSDPLFVAFSKKQRSAEAARAAGTQLSARGFSRMSRQQLSRVRALKLELAAKSSVCCEAFWVGDLDMNTLYVEMQKHFSETEFRDWMQLSMMSMRLELEGVVPARRFSQESLSTSFLALQEVLPPDRWQFFAKTMKLGTSAPRSTGCEALLLMMEQVPNLRREDQDVLNAFFISPTMFE